MFVVVAAVFVFVLGLFVFVFVVAMCVIVSMMVWCRCSTSVVVLMRVFVMLECCGSVLVRAIVLVRFFVLIVPKFLEREREREILCDGIKVWLV